MRMLTDEGLEEDMLELIIAGAVGVYGHVKSRKFVGRKLRYTDVVEKPLLGVWTGVGTTVLMAPVVAVLPVVGAGLAVAAGAGVGTGVHLGVRDTKKPPELIED